MAVKLRGSADLLQHPDFALLDVTCAWNRNIASYRGVGLWEFAVNSGGIETAMTNRKDTARYPGFGRPFAAEDAGYVEITGLAPGREIMLKIELANVSNITNVVTELTGNPMFSDLEAVGGEAVRLRFTPAWSGTGYFVWDNAPGSVNHLGADVIRVSPMLLPGTVMTIF